MSQINSLKRPFLACDGVASSVNDYSSTPHKRRRQTNQALEALGQLVKNPSIDDVDNKLNKNDILSLTLARLLRQKYWPVNVYNKNVGLASNIESLSTIDDMNGFIMVCNMNGRIIVMSDNVESYLRKNVRSLYPQLTSIYNCVSDDDHASIRQILSTPNYTEQRIICKWKLTRGKRPSRNHTETKTMLMTGHFFFVDDTQQREQQEPLFIARCEQILSSTPNVPSNTTGSISSTTIRLVLNEQLHINEISPNLEALLGYKAEDLIDQSLKRILAAEHIGLLDEAKQNCMLTQHYTTMHVMDLFTNSGDRLTFLCNIHMLVEGRRKATKLGFLAQLIDPVAANEFMIYADKQNVERLRTTAQQESLSLFNMDFDSSATTNILYSQNEQGFDIKEFSLVCPTTILPQRRKRRKVSRKKVKQEPVEFFNQTQQSPQLVSDSNESHVSSSESVSSASPIQEMGLTDELQAYFHDIFECDKIKLIRDLPSIEDVIDILGMRDDEQCLLLTPTISSANFFT